MLPTAYFQLNIPEIYKQNITSSTGQGMFVCVCTTGACAAVCFDWNAKRLRGGWEDFLDNNSSKAVTNLSHITWGKSNE